MNVAVRCVWNVGQYKPGETAQIEKKDADRLVKMGAVIILSDPEPIQTEPEPEQQLVELEPIEEEPADTPVPVPRPRGRPARRT